MRILLVFIFTFNAFALSKPREIVENFDLRYYSPQQLGLRDLYFEIRISNLKESLLKKVPLGKITEVYYSVYWITPGKYKIEVMGLPKGYKELKNELVQLVSNRLDFVLPQKLSPKLRSYKLKYNSSKTMILGVDETHSRTINNIELVFDKSGKLRRFKTKSPVGSNTSNLEMSKKPWSKNKWVVDSIEVISAQGIQLTKIKNRMTYKVIDGFGLPSQVDITTSQELQVSDKSNVKPKRTISTTIKFENYKINKGLARKKLIGK